MHDQREALESPEEARRRFFHRLRYQLRHPFRFRRLRRQCEKYRCIFVHIPKCAGTSIRQSLFVNHGGHKTLAGYRDLLGPELVESCFKFTFVRNPWDRLASAFFFLKNRNMKSNKKWAKENLSAYNDFGSFVRHWVNRESVWTYSHFRPQYQFICLEGTRPAVDFIGFYENLAADFLFVSKKLNLQATLSEENRNPIRARSYLDYYTDETRRIVADAYAEDIQLFGYSFDNSSLPAQLEARGARRHPAPSLAQARIA